MELPDRYVTWHPRYGYKLHVKTSMGEWGSYISELEAKREELKGTPLTQEVKEETDIERS